MENNEVIVSVHPGDVMLELCDLIAVEIMIQPEDETLLDLLDSSSEYSFTYCYYGPWYFTGQLTIVGGYGTIVEITKYLVGQVLVGIVYWWTSSQPITSSLSEPDDQGATTAPL